MIKQKKKEKKGVAGIEKVERSGNREMWDNSEKRDRKKKKGVVII